jgi:hypothetical protein
MLEDIAPTVQLMSRVAARLSGFFVPKKIHIVLVGGHRSGYDEPFWGNAPPRGHVPVEEITT